MSRTGKTTELLLRMATGGRRSGEAQAKVLRAVADGLHRMTDLPEDRFVDPSEDPDDVIARVAGYLSRADFLIRRAVASLDEACTEIRELQTVP